LHASEELKQLTPAEATNKYTRLQLTVPHVVDHTGSAQRPSPTK